MNIKQAKEHIKYAVRSYLTRNEFGELIIPVERQRPIFMIGAPGIGKTAIMEQIAQEEHIGLVSYSMTHHTRQSALGLPFITHKTYGGMEYDVSEYTMSEIIASVYEMMETSGVKEGILFLDEINCVSETLAPSMLQFLQYKVFGRHKIPDGWIVVTAGNPNMYNDSVRDFDIVTWDRLKRVDVEPDFEVWKEYAIARAVHPAIISYLEIKRDDFHNITADVVDGKKFVTARGWVDLSDMIKLFEMNGFEVDEQLVKQYMNNEAVSKSFAAYYDLFKKYRSDYQVDRILDGSADAKIFARAAKAEFDERLSLISLMLDAAGSELKRIALTEGMMRTLTDYLRAVKTLAAKSSGEEISKEINRKCRSIEEENEQGRKANSMNEDAARANRMAIMVLDRMASAVKDCDSGKKAFDTIIKKSFDDENKKLKTDAAGVKKKLENMFVFAENAFGEGNEMLIMVTELTMNPSAAKFLGKYGCEAYFRHNRNLLVNERRMEILKKIDDILDEFKLDEENQGQ